MMSSSRVSSLNVVSTMPMVRSLSLATAGAVPASSPEATTAATADRAKAREIRDFFMIVMGLWQAPILTSRCPHVQYSTRARIVPSMESTSFRASVLDPNSTSTTT